MTRSRPWLLVLAVVVAALLIATVLGLDPPEEGKPGWHTQGFALRTENVELPAIKSGQGSTFPTVRHFNDRANVTSFRISGVLSLENVRGDGDLFARLQVTTPTIMQNSTRNEIYACNEFGPTPVFFTQCASVDLARPLDLAKTRVREAPVPERVQDDPDSSSFDPPPPDRTHVGRWNFTLVLEHDEDVTYDEARLQMVLILEWYELREQE